MESYTGNVLKEIKQTDVTQNTGNCLQVCVAMLLGLELDDVPNFKAIAWEDGEGRGTKVIWKLEQWLSSMGLALMSIGGQYKHLQGTLGIYGFAALKSKRYDAGVHAVVWRMDRKGKPQCYWDPDPDSKWRYYDLTDKALRYYVIVPKPGWYGALTE